MKLETKKDIQDTTPRAKFGWRGTTGRGSAKGGHFRWLLCAFPFWPPDGPNRTGHKLST